MVGLGFLMFGLGLFSLLARWRKTLYTNRLLHRAALVMAPAPIVAMLCGWMTTEIGRQPYTVYGVLRTIDSVSPIALPGIATSLAVFAVVYFIVFGAGIAVILRMMSRPPVAGETRHPQGQADPDGGHSPGPARSRAARHRRRPPCSPRSDRPMSAETIATIWAGLIAFAVLAYVLLDGFDLGVGILFAAERGSEDRDTMVNTIAPMWDGNETWLVLGGAGLFAVFPLAYAVIMPALYPTIFAMLFGLILRGVAFELRFRVESSVQPKALGFRLLSAARPWRRCARA